MDSTAGGESQPHERVRQQEAVAELSQQALEADDLEQLLGDACDSVAETLGTEYAAVFERRDAADELCLREGAGWPESDDRVGSATIPVDSDTLTGAALRSADPVAVDDLGAAGRVTGSALLADSGVESGLTVRIGPSEDPWGVLGAYATEPRAFTDADATFVRTVASVLATTIEQLATERRFDAVFDDPNILVGLLEPDGTVVDINETAMEYIDADLADVTGELFWETPWWADESGATDAREDVEQWTERAAAGEYVDFEADLTRPDGDRYTLSGYFRPVTNDDGEVVSIIVSDRDVTERKRRERQLEESERRYRTLVEHFPNGAVALVDADLRYRTVGGSPLDVADVTVEEIEGEPAADVLPSELADELVPRYEAAIEEGESSTFETESNGRIYWFHVVPIRDDDGTVFAALGMSQDITERRESERRYRTLVENFPNGAVGLFNEDLQYTVAGGEILSEIDTSEEEIVGETIWERYPDELAAQFEPNFRAALEGETNSFEMEFHGRHWAAYTLPVENDDGDIGGGGMMMVQDITERKEIERQLRESEAKFRMVAENLDEIVWMIRPDTKEFLYVNPTYEDVFGQDRDALYDDQYAFAERLHPEDRDRVLAAWNGLPEEPYDEVFRIVRPDDEVRWIHARATYIHDESDDVSRIVGISNDITERKERERELERALDLLNKTERIADVAGWEIVPDTMDVFWSDNLFEMLDVSSDEQPSLDEALSVYDTEDDRGIVEDAIENALETGEPFDIEARFSRPDGDVGWLRVQGDPEFEDSEGRRPSGNRTQSGDGEVVSLRGAVQDITEQKERERQLEELVDKLEESNERLEQFAYAASHDLQEPLRMVSSYLELLERRYADDLDADAEEFIEFAVDGANRMRAMIDALLEYSRVDTRGDPLEPVDLDHVLEDVLANLQVRIDESDAEITADSLPRVRGDESQLRQVLQNLLENAIEYSGDEPPRVHLSTVRRGREWEVSVRDEGIGIDPDDKERIFEVFQRLHSREQHAGTGIGLALCERIVERHGGDIWVDSEPGEGATFSFTLPATET